MLNADQQAAFEAIQKWLTNSSDKYFHLSGKGGTGKTYLVSHIIKHYPNAIITATTNKAASVLAEQGLPALTIYKQLGLRVSDDFSTGERNIKPVNGGNFIKEGLLIIDEASMINDTLKKFLDNLTGPSVKILFVGDKYQLNPVKTLISPVYSLQCGMAELLTPVRNKGSQALLDVCQMARDTVISGSFTDITQCPNIEVVNKTDLRDVIDKEFVNEDPKTAILAYTNAKVLAYAEYIRELRGYSDPFIPGEYVVNNDFVEINKEESLYANQQLIIKEVLDEGLVNSIYKFNNLIVEDEIMGYEYTIQAFQNPDEKRAYAKELARQKNWKKYFQLQKCFADLRPSCSLTVHKSQGSTYNTIIADLGDISTCTTATTTARLQYVAVSRPSTKLYLTGKLAARYFK